MSTPPWPMRRERNIEWHLKITTLNLLACYKTLQLDEPAVNFAKAIQNFVETMLEPSIDSPLEILKQFFSGIENSRNVDDIARSAIGPVIVGCVYQVRARSAMESKDLNLAWSYTADAQYWCGISVCDRDIDVGLKQIINTEREKASAEALTAKAKAGAQAQKIPYVRLRTYVYEEARKPMSRWESRAHAADVIAKKAMKYVQQEEAKAKSEGRKSQLPKIRGSSENFKRTMDSWLKEMPDASTLFAPKKSKS